MAKKRNSSVFSKILKKSSMKKKFSISGIILILISALYQLSANFLPHSPTKVPASDSTIELYSNQTQDDLTHLYVQAIEQAKSSITLVIYALTDQAITQALYKKSEAGIPVYIVSDAKASPGLTKKLPKATIIRRVGEGLMHQKILVIDQKQVWLGSSNFTPSSLKVHGNLVIGIDNPALAEALTTRIKSMDEEGGVSSPLLHKETAAGFQNIELWVLPDDPTAVRRMIELFRSAKKSIKVAMFTWTRVDFTQELLAAAKRGVKVEAVIDRYAGKGAGAKVVKMLEDGKIPVRLSTGKGLLHHKFAYIDDRILINGSANWTAAAFKTNDDVFMVVDPLTPEQQAKMNTLWQILLKESDKPGALSNTQRSSYHHYDD